MVVFNSSYVDTGQTNLEDAERVVIINNSAFVEDAVSNVASDVFSEKKSESTKKADFKVSVIRAFKTVLQTLKIMKMAISALLYYIATRFASGCMNLAYVLFFLNQRRSCGGLVTTDHSVDFSKEKYEVNKGLMTDIAARYEDEDSQRGAEFLTANFLGKVAPTQMHILNKIVPKAEEKFQTNSRCQYHYHRYGFIDNPEIGQQVNKRVFALAKESPFIPTDTIAFDHLYSLVFETVEGLDFPMDSLFSHFTSQEKKPLSIKLKKPLMFDLTERFEGKMHKKGEEEARAELTKIKEEAAASLERAATELAKSYPRYSKAEIKKWLKNSSVFVCRVQDSDSSLCGVKVLPVFQKMSKGKFIKNNPGLVEFISNTGLFIGAVNLRRHLWSQPLDKEETRFCRDSKGEYSAFLNYYKDRDAILKTKVFIRNEEKFQDAQPHYQALGLGTMQLIRGLIDEVTDERWKELLADDFKNEVIQFSLYSILIELASAELAMTEDDFDAFSLKIELIHSQLGNLLEVIRPFKERQYVENYQKMIGKIPKIDSEFITPGLCKTGMNAFAAITAAIAESSENPVRAYGKGFYFEQAGFIGSDNSLEAILEDESIEKVDLYACQFFPNVEISSDFTHYEKGKVSEDIRAILEKKPKTEHLTVAVDCTIDFINSESMKTLLAEFKDEIKKGKLNFVFFRSGQKLDQFGMDSYYGAPYVQVNNRAEHWKPFENIHHDKAFRTDPLSLQWFTLAFTYAASSMDQYRKLIFENARQIVDQLPERLKPSDDPSHQLLRVSTFSEEMQPSFIDIKLTGFLHGFRAKWILARFYEKFNREGYNINTRASFGFIQPNFVIIQINEVPDSTTIRLNPGLNPKQNKFISDLIKECS